MLCKFEIFPCSTPVLLEKFQKKNYARRRISVELFVFTYIIILC